MNLEVEPLTMGEYVIRKKGLVPVHVQGTTHIYELGERRIMIGDEVRRVYFAYVIPAELTLEKAVIAGIRVILREFEARDLSQ